LYGLKGLVSELLGTGAEACDIPEGVWVEVWIAGGGYLAKNLVNCGGRLLANAIWRCVVAMMV
jgi:hypothetical protein